MRKSLIVLLACFMVLACRKQTPAFIDVERSTIYHGQTVVSLYDNFGPPRTHAIDPYGVRELHYKSEDIQNRGLDKKYYFCDLFVYLDDDIVIDWIWTGNKCHINAVKKDFYIEND